MVDKCWDDFIKNEITYSNELEHIGYEAIFRAGFEAAKRSQPIVKVDRIRRYGSPDDILACISEAGIKYTIGE